MKNLIFFILAGVFYFVLTGCATARPRAKQLNEVSYGHDSLRNSASPSVYSVRGECNGLPRVSVKTAPGFCLGLVDNGEGLIKPRYALQIDPKHLLVTDMGGWKPNNGQIYLLTFENKKWTRKSYFNSSNVSADEKCILDRPQQLVFGPNNQIFVTSAQCVAVLSMTQKNPTDQITIQIRNLPTDGLHPAKVITFDPVGNIYMNVGSITDNCELETTETCKETEGLSGRGVIRKYARLANGDYDSNYTIFAKGQRNSMALHWDVNSSTLWTAENARDYIERKDSRLNGQEKPSDEMNIIQENAQLDWPYCYDRGLVSPEFPKAICSQYVPPHLLFPAHSAPLSFLMYSGNLFPKWYQNRLLVSFHGYAPYGHRIVTYKRNENVQPVGDPLSIVFGWDARGNQKVGSPVGLTQGLDGSVFIVEDNSQKILQLYYNKSEGDGAPVAELKLGTIPVDESKLAADFQKAEEKRKLAFTAKMNQSNPPLFSRIQSSVIDTNCTMCHGGVNYPGIQLLKYDDIGNYKKLKEQLWARLNGQGIPQMPPSGLPESDKAQLLELVKQWMDAGSPAP